MPRNVYSEINLHIVWHTKDDMPVLCEHIKDRAHRFIKHYGADTPGVFIHEVGGIEDHVHVVATVPPTLVISGWIGKAKGASSHYINHTIANRKVLEWQTGYGVVSFGTRDLPWVICYVRDQEKHHREGTAHDRLEQIEAEAEEDKDAEAP